MPRITTSVISRSSGPECSRSSLRAASASARGHQAVTAIDERRRDEIEHGRLVFDQEDRLAVAAGSGRLGLRRAHGGARRQARQENAEDRASSGDALGGDEAAALSDDAVDRRQAEPGSLALLLGGEEGLEDVRQGLLVHADAAVRNREHAVPARGDLGAGERAGDEVCPCPHRSSMSSSGWFRRPAWRPGR